jgi:hypothetical protein
VPAGVTGTTVLVRVFFFAEECLAAVIFMSAGRDRSLFRVSLKAESGRVLAASFDVHNRDPFWQIRHESSILIKQ